MLHCFFFSLFCLYIDINSKDNHLHNHYLGIYKIRLYSYALCIYAYICKDIDTSLIVFKDILSSGFLTFPVLSCNIEALIK